jgi:hypothetical protein
MIEAVCSCEMSVTQPTFTWCAPKSRININTSTHPNALFRHSNIRISHLRYSCMVPYLKSLVWHVLKMFEQLCTLSASRKSLKILHRWAWKRYQDQVWPWNYNSWFSLPRRGSTSCWLPSNRRPIYRHVSLNFFFSFWTLYLLNMILCSYVSSHVTTK